MFFLGNKTQIWKEQLMIIFEDNDIKYVLTRNNEGKLLVSKSSFINLNGKKVNFSEPFTVAEERIIRFDEDSLNIYAAFDGDDKYIKGYKKDDTKDIELLINDICEYAEGKEIEGSGDDFGSCAYYHIEKLYVGYKDDLPVFVTGSQDVIDERKDLEFSVINYDGMVTAL